MHLKDEVEILRASRASITPILSIKTAICAQYSSIIMDVLCTDAMVELSGE